MPQILPRVESAPAARTAIFSAASTDFRVIRRGTLRAPDDGRMGDMSGSEEMKPESRGVKLTYEDYVRFPADGNRHELIDGEHYVTPSPNLDHQAIQTNLLGMIWSFLQVNPIGRVFGAPLDVIFSKFDVVEPDVLYVSNGRAEQVLTGEWVHGAPDLVVEIGSKSTRRRDETIKRRLYEQFAVLEYWIVDPTHHAVKVFRRVGDRYELVAELTLENADVLTTPLLPGLDLALVKIFDV
jgi:Uma2 family endonuclease